MPVPRPMLLLAAAAAGALPLALGGGVSALATTPAVTPSPVASPGPTPTPTIAPTPLAPPETRTLCADVFGYYPPQQALRVTSNDEGTALDVQWRQPIDWQVGTCYPSPVLWQLTVDGEDRGQFVGDSQATTISGLEPGSTHTIKVVALNGSASMSRTFTTGPFPCVDPPAGEAPTSVPVIRSIAARTSNGRSSATISWRPPDGCRPKTVAYRIFTTRNLRPEFPASNGTTAVIDDLKPGQSYNLSVGSIDEQGGFEWSAIETLTTPGEASEPTPTPPPTPTPTPPLEVTRKYTTRGALAFRGQGLSGNFALKSSATLRIRTFGPQGVFGELPPAEATGNLVFAGLLPIRTTIALSGGTLGGVLTDQLRATTDRTLTVRRATFAGLVLTSGDTCKSTAPIAVDLAGPFTSSGGGRLTGQFATGRFTGCGVLDYYLSSGAPRSSLTLEFTPDPPPTPLPLPAPAS